MMILISRFNGNMIYHRHRIFRKDFENQPESNVGFKSVLTSVVLFGGNYGSPRRLRAKYSLCTNLRFMTKDFVLRRPSGGSHSERRR